MSIKTHSFNVSCDCGHSRDHLVSIVHHEDEFRGDRSDLLTISTGMNHFLPWYKRLAIACKYVLGIDNTYCQYTETYVSDPQEITRLRTFLSDTEARFNK